MGFLKILLVDVEKIYNLCAHNILTRISFNKIYLLLN